MKRHARGRKMKRRKTSRVVERDNCRGGDAILDDGKSTNETCNAEAQDSGGRAR